MTTIIKGDPRFNKLAAEGRGDGRGLSVEGTDRKPFAAGLFQDVTDVQWGGGSGFFFATGQWYDNGDFRADNYRALGAISFDGIHWTTLDKFVLPPLGEDRVRIGTGALPGGGQWTGSGGIGCFTILSAGAIFITGNNHYYDDDGDLYTHATLSLSLDFGKSWNEIANPNQYWVHDTGFEPHINNGQPPGGMAYDPSTGTLYVNFEEQGLPPGDFVPSFSGQGDRFAWFTYSWPGQGETQVVQKVDPISNSGPFGFNIPPRCRIATSGFVSAGFNFFSKGGRRTSCTLPGEFMSTVTASGEKITIENDNAGTLFVNGEENAWVDNNEFRLYAACCGMGVIAISGFTFAGANDQSGVWISKDGGKTFTMVTSWPADDATNSVNPGGVCFG